MKITVKIPVQRPHCRTPIKPKQAHTVATQYVRKPKHPHKDY